MDTRVNVPEKPRLARVKDIGPTLIQCSDDAAIHPGIQLDLELMSGAQETIKVILPARGILGLCHALGKSASKARRAIRKMKRDN